MACVVSVTLDRDGGGRGGKEYLKFPKDELKQGYIFYSEVILEHSNKA